MKVWSVDPALEEISTDVVSTARYFSKEAVGGGGGDGPGGFSHLGKIAWHPEASHALQFPNLIIQYDSSGGLPKVPVCTSPLCRHCSGHRHDWEQGLLCMLLQASPMSY